MFHLAVKVCHRWKTLDFAGLEPPIFGKLHTNFSVLVEDKLSTLAVAFGSEAFAQRRKQAFQECALIYVCMAKTSI